MPTGPKHYRIREEMEGGQLVEYQEECRCMIGEDHAEDAYGERLSVWDAADIWMSKGMDEDYMFGYAEDELRRAAGMD